MALTNRGPVVVKLTRFVVRRSTQH